MQPNSVLAQYPSTCQRFKPLQALIVVAADDDGDDNDDDEGPAGTEPAGTEPADTEPLVGGAGKVELTGLLIT